MQRHHEPPILLYTRLRSMMSKEAKVQEPFSRRGWQIPFSLPTENCVLKLIAFQTEKRICVSVTTYNWNTFPAILKVLKPGAGSSS
jgi:hypothetical protein